jgi:hypothetical protein
MNCTCSSCSACRGTGSIYVDMGGRVVPYFDDLCDLETCDECGGSGTCDECEYCRQQREWDEDARG